MSIKKLSLLKLKKQCQDTFYQSIDDTLQLSNSQTYLPAFTHALNIDNDYSKKMFILNEDTIGTSLTNINLISLSYYSLKSEILNIYDTNFNFNENCIPLITSVLEIEPKILHTKKYINVDSETIITIDNNKRNHNNSTFF